MPDVIAVCVTLTALLAYLNHRFVGLPPTIGIMGIALIASVSLIGLDALGFSILKQEAAKLLASIDFSIVLMQGMLSILLFAGALHVDLRAMHAHRWQIGALAVIGTVVSTVIVGVAMWVVLPYCGITLPFTYCLLFGTLISPTDPIAVIAILKSAHAPRSLEAVIAGESLFNDGIGVVLFTLMFGIAISSDAPSTGQAATLLLREAGGGLIFGFALGLITYFLVKSIDSYQEEVLVSLAAVLGGYALANHLHVSGPLAMVVAGLIVGNHGREFAMSEVTRAHLDSFWELLDSILNAFLFMLIGLEMVVIAISPTLALAGLAAIVVTLGARLASVGLPIAVLGARAGLPRGAWQILSWGGLRGGISVALALSLPFGPARDIIATLTYAVVVFSIAVQGISFGALVRRYLPAPQ